MLHGVRAAAVSLGRSPRFTSPAILTLTAGMLLALISFAVLRAVVLRELPYRDAGRVVVLWAAVPEKGIERDWTSLPALEDWRTASRTLAESAIQLRIETAVLGGEEPLRVESGRVSASLFPLLGVSPIRGRTFTVEEEQRREAVVLISEPFWRSRFAGAEDAVGRTIELDRRQARIIGVMPEAFAFPSETTDVWMPVSYVEQWPAFLKARQADAFRGIARLKPGVSLEQARAELAGIALALEAEHPLTDKGKTIHAVALTDEMRPPSMRRALWLVMLAVVLVLLVAAGHAASLFLARSYVQRGEIAIRLALGATFGDLLRLRLAEAMVVSMAACAVAVLLAVWALGLVTALLPALPGLRNVRVDGAVALFALGMCCVSTAIGGLVPAWTGRQGDVRSWLGGVSKGSAGGGIRRRGQQLLVTAQLAATTLLVLVATLLWLSYWKLQRVDQGFDPGGVVVAGPVERAHSSGAMFFDNVIAAAGQVPGVRAAGAVSNVFSAYVPNNMIEVEGKGLFESERNVDSVVAGEYFQALGIPLIEGRLFGSADRIDAPKVAVVDRTMAERFWRGERAAGKRFRFGVPGEDRGSWVTVIGVVGATLPNGPESESIPHFYLPLAQRPYGGAMEVVARAVRVDAALMTAVRRAVRDANPGTLRFEVEPLGKQVERLGARRRANTVLLGGFALVSLMLSAIGLYALIHFIVLQRTAEIGMRMALGAAPGRVFRLILWQGARSAMAGMAMGSAGAVVVVRLLARFVYGLDAYHPVAFPGAILLLWVVAMMATAAPAWGAARLSPLRALAER